MFEMLHNLTVQMFKGCNDWQGTGVTATAAWSIGDQWEAVSRHSMTDAHTRLRAVVMVRWREAIAQVEHGRRRGIIWVAMEWIHGNDC